MPKYVAFLRAINVGGHLVKMDYLRTLFEALSFDNVETFIASGNVIFDSKAKNTQSLEKKIESELKKALGYEVVTFVRAVSELAAIADHPAFSKSELNGNALFIGFLANEPTAQAKAAVLSLCNKVDDYRLNKREIYWLLRKHFSESEVSGPQLAKALGMPTTMRNVTTIRRLAAKYGK
jgi:uncharacterized protein (DUF1697 family)